MDIASRRFNFYLLAGLGALLLCGCQSAKSKKVETTLRIHAEATDDTSFTRKIKVYQDESLTMKVHELPFITETDIVEAQVVEALGGFALQLKFNPRTRWVLDHHTSMNIGRHFAIFVQFGAKPSVARWIAAPIISGRNSDGMMIFTPDATREEAEQIVQGLPKKESKLATETDWNPAGK